MADYSDYFSQSFSNLGPNLRYRVHARGVEERYSGNIGQVRITYDVPWQQRWIFCLKVLGDAYVAAGSVVRTIPMSYVLHTDNSAFNIDPSKHWLWATQIERIEGIRPLGVNEKKVSSLAIPVFDIARVTVLFESLSYRVVSDQDMIAAGKSIPNPYGGKNPDGTPASFLVDEATLCRYVTRMIQPNAEYLSLPFGRYRWAEDDGDGYKGTLVTGAQLGVIIPFQEVVYIWHQVPVVPKPFQDIDGGPPAYAVPSAAKTLLGAVNNNRFDKFEKGTLLLTSVEVKPYRWIGGAYFADVTYKMKYFNAVDPSTQTLYPDNRGHNYFLHFKNPNPKTGLGFKNYKYELVTHDGTPTGIKVYREGDFKTLFRPDTAS